MAPRSERSGISPQRLSLPKGGGAIQGLGETFQPDINTGTGSFSVPLDLPEGRNGFTPAVALSYSTVADNGAFGLGWSLDVPVIQRRTRRGVPRYDHKDIFVLSRSEDLVEVDRRQVAGNLHIRYHPRTGERHVRILRIIGTSGADDYWEVTTADGTRSVFGHSAAARVVRPGSAGKDFFAWHLERSTDTRGNVIAYRYAHDPGSARAAAKHAGEMLYLSGIDYGNYVDPSSGQERFLYAVELDYGQFDDHELPSGQWSVRPDPFSTYRAGFELRTRRRCQRILLLCLHPQANAPTHLVRSVDLYYKQDTETGVSLLEQIVQRGYSLTPPGRESRDWDATAQSDKLAGLHRATALFASAFPPLRFDYTWQTRPKRALTPLRFDCDRPPPASLADENYDLIDLYGDGLPDIVASMANGWYCWRNLGDGQFATPSRLRQAPAGLALSDPAVTLMDFDGSGSTDLVVTDGPRRGVYPNAFTGDWRAWRPAGPTPAVALNDPKMRLVDADGDGRVDALVTSDHHLLFNRNRSTAARLSFDEPQSNRRRHDPAQWPDIDFSDPQRRIRMADMTGDGLQDIVRLHERRIEYWPALGHGRFAARVRMAASPTLPWHFKPERLFLADINGDGLADLIYVDLHCVHYWINRSGNEWGPRQTVACTPRASSDASVRLVDLFGTGAAGILWSAPASSTRRERFFFLELSAGEPAMLLAGIDNNRGASTRIDYVSSTRFQNDDRAAGQPWITTLPFPVHVVASTDVTDAIGQTRQFTKYRYRHGHYDGIERAFCGFAQVDQIEEVGGGTAGDAPTLIRSWFHTGAHLRRRSVIDLISAEFWSGDPVAACARHDVDTTDAPRRAYRALNGALLRTEVYKQDGGSGTETPCIVTEFGYRVSVLHTPKDEKEGVFRRALRESVTSHYESDPDDPRVTHLLNASFDAFGHVLRYAEIAYPRRMRPTAAPWSDDQRKRHIRLVDRAFVNLDQPGQLFLSGYLYERRETALTEEAPPGTLLDEASLQQVVNASAAKLLSHERHYFDGPDYVGLPLGQIGTRGLAMRTERLAFDADTLHAVYGARVDANDLMAAHYHESPSGSGNWWINGRRTRYAAADRFFQPLSQLDARGNETTMSYDAFELFPVRIDAPLSNSLRGRIDYRVGRPCEITDANGNMTGVVFDALGFVVAMARGGKPADPAGDSLTGFSQNVSGDPFTEPAAWLQRASCRFIVSLFRFHTDRSPNCIHVLGRESHAVTSQASGTNKIQQSVIYSDGFGREVQTRLRAPAGDINGTQHSVRWLVTGWEERDGRGRTRRQYAPCYTADARFAPAPFIGTAEVFHYDVAGRVERTDHPDGSFSRTEFGAWHETQWDRNDTVATSAWYQKMMSGNAAAQSAANQTLAHADTPHRVHYDARGRAFLAVRDCGQGRIHETHTNYDHSDLATAVRDAAGREAARYHYDLLGRDIDAWHLDAGRRIRLLDAMGLEIRSWTSGGHLVERAFDALSRPIALWVTDPGAAAGALIEKTVYGESHPDPARHNLRGEVWQRFDQSGVETVEAYDFKGNPLRSRSQLLDAASGTADWSAAPPLHGDVYGRAYENDALGRMRRETVSLNGAVLAVFERDFDTLNTLQTVDVTLRNGTTPYRLLDGVMQNARQQPTRIHYGNGILCEKEYDPDTGRAERQRVHAPSATPIQDLRYGFDPVGNLLSIEDHAAQTVFFANAAVPPHRSFVYDSAYRLVKATGREHAGAPSGIDPRDPPRAYPLPHPSDGQALRNWTRTYDYDAVGNLTQLHHQTSQGAWTKDLTRSANSNRLTSVSSGSASASCQYDAAGNMTTPGSASVATLHWNFDGRLRSADLGGGAMAHYRYDHTGRRSRKVVVLQNGYVREQHCIGPLQIKLEYASQAAFAAGTPRFRVETLRVEDGAQTLGLIESVRIENHVDLGAAPRDTIRYPVGDHLGSTHLEMDASGNVLTFEEYYPYGGTSYRAARRAGLRAKTARYVGKQKDSETGLYHIGARYYAPWLGVWVSTDPQVSENPGTSPYVYANANPIRFVDPSGESSSDAVELGVLGIRTLVFAVFGGMAGTLAGAIGGGIAAHSRWGGVGATVGGVLVGSLAGTVGGAVLGAVTSLATSRVGWRFLYRGIRAFATGVGRATWWAARGMAKVFTAIGRGLVTALKWIGSSVASVFASSQPKPKPGTPVQPPSTKVPVNTPAQTAPKTDGVKPAPGDPFKPPSTPARPGPGQDKDDPFRQIPSPLEVKPPEESRTIRAGVSLPNGVEQVMASEILAAGWFDLTAMPFQAAAA